MEKAEINEISSKIFKQYGIGKATVSDIKRNKKRILEYISSTDKGPGNMKTLKLSAHPLVEKCFYTWFLQERAQHKTNLKCIFSKHYKLKWSIQMELQALTFVWDGPQKMKFTLIKCFYYNFLLFLWFNMFSLLVFEFL